MTYNFCTYFDHNYLYKGLALYLSLQQHCPKFTLWILPTSDSAYAILEKLALSNVRLIRMRDFEDPELLAVKPTRTVVEYMWTLTPSLPLSILKKNPDLEEIAYIDADCFFFADPEPLYKEMGRDSVLVIEHRYAPDRKDWEITSGRFNVGLLVFRRDTNGLATLRWWRERCLEWCYHRYEDGKLGDQLYLNAWPELFSGIHILEHKGGCVAPWNVANYHLSEDKEQVFVDHDPLIFYHFHALKMFSEADFEPATGYRFTPEQLRLIYEPYYQTLRQAVELVHSVEPTFDHGRAERLSLSQRLRDVAVKILKPRQAK
jgi:hypothetical protein